MKIIAKILKNTSNVIYNVGKVIKFTSSNNSITKLGLDKVNFITSH